MSYRLSATLLGGFSGIRSERYASLTAGSFPGRCHSVSRAGRGIGHVAYRGAIGSTGSVAGQSYPDAGHVLSALVGIIAGHALPRLRAGRSLIDEGVAGRTLNPLGAACRGLSGRSGSLSSGSGKAIEAE